MNTQQLIEDIKAEPTTPSRVAIVTRLEKKVYKESKEMKKPLAVLRAHLQAAKLDGILEKLNTGKYNV